MKRKVLEDTRRKGFKDIWSIFEAMGSAQSKESMDPALKESPEVEFELSLHLGR